MTRIGVTGRMNLTPPTVPLVREAIRQALAPYVPEGLTGVSCIAVGADSIFAEVVLDLGGAYEAANETLVGSSDRLVAVWDGRAPADKGGTVAVVQYAESRGLPVEIIWPEGAERS